MFDSGGFSLCFRLPLKITPPQLGYEAVKLTLLSSFSFLFGAIRIYLKVYS